MLEMMQVHFFMLRKQFQGYINDVFKKKNLRSSEVMILAILFQFGEKSQIEISKLLECDKAHTHRIVNRLIAKNLIVYTNDCHEHARNAKLCLTEQGIKISGEFISSIKKWNKLLREGVSNEEIAVVKNVIQKMMHNAEKYKELEKNNV